MDSSQRRKAANEVVFREVNERIQALGSRLGINENEPLHLVCECDRISCAEPLFLGREEYERARADSTHFIVVTGHEDPKVEDVVDTGPNYLIVRKHRGEPADFARMTDPRS
jgi:hypothetical protein